MVKDLTDCFMGLLTFLITAGSTYPDLTCTGLANSTSLSEEYWMSLRLWSENDKVSSVVGSLQTIDLLLRLVTFLEPWHSFLFLVVLYGKHWLILCNRTGFLLFLCRLVDYLPFFAAWRGEVQKLASVQTTKMLVLDSFAKWKSKIRLFSLTFLFCQDVCVSRP